MPLLTYTLAKDRTGAWQIAFDADELHLFIGKAKQNLPPDPVKGMTAEDFLVIVPRGPLHRRAHERFIDFLTRALRPVGSDNVG